jgi:uncharacterized cupredoxin-like copper-binding protein
MRVGHSHICAGVAVLVLSFTAGCGGGDGGQTAPDDHVGVVEKDFRISAPAAVAAGPVDLDVTNKGPIAHELLVVRGARGSLPMRADGVTVDEDAVENRTAGALEPTGAGESELSVDLAPGHYVLLCNMSGHFRAGMHTELVVR